MKKNKLIYPLIIFILLLFSPSFNMKGDMAYSNAAEKEDEAHRKYSKSDEKYAEALLSTIVSSFIEQDMELVKNNLRYNLYKLSNHVALLPHLEKIKLVAYPHFSGNENAWSKRAGDGKHEIVNIDIGFAGTHKVIARFTATAMIGFLSNDYLATFQKGWSDIVAEEFRKYKTIPNLVFPIWKYLSNEEDVKLIESLTRTISLDVMSFVVLHEIAHHVLDHLDPVLNAKLDSMPELEKMKISREMEKEADLWAFKKMFEMDYTMFYLKRFLGALAYIEEAENNAMRSLGYEVKVDRRSHPWWITREKLLSSNYKEDNLFSKKSPWIFLKAVVQTGKKADGKPYIANTDIGFPKNPDSSGIFMGYVIIDNIYQAVAIEIKQGNVYLYGRTKQGLLKIVIHQPEKWLTKIEFWQMLDGKKPNLLKTAYAFYDSYVPYYGGKTKEGIITGQMLNFSPIAVIQEVLSKANISKDTAERVIFIQKKNASMLGELTLKFMKGNISAKQFESDFKSLKKALERDTKSILGDSTYNKYEAIMLEKKVVQKGIANIISASKSNATGQVNILDMLDSK